MKYYEVRVDKTGKAVGSKDTLFSVYDTEKETFETLQEAKQFIKDTYANKSRGKMYVDTKAGETKHIGYIYKMGINWDCSHNTGEKWYEQHWVQVNEVQKTTILI